MKVLYISSSCSEIKYQQIYKIRKIKGIEPQQKFNFLFATGISEVDNTEVTALSGLPVSSSTCDQNFFEYEKEIYSSSLIYEYVAFRNGKFSRYIDLYRNTKALIKKWVKKNKGEQCCIIVDVLVPFMIMGGFSIAKKFHVPVIGVVTDLPELTSKMKERKEGCIKRMALVLLQWFNKKTLKRYDGFVSLTQSINEVVNPLALKPEIVVEGSVDSRIDYQNSTENQPPVVVYAGGVYAKYGVKKLVEAFIKVNSPAVLHVYGDGSYVEELKQVSNLHSQIQYKGMASLEEIVEIERKASLLINPRPSNEEFSKFSFPSKTLEYMASGTPLLSTRLPGIPKPYFNYIYAIDDETTDGMVAALEFVLSLPEKERVKKGKEAFDFVKNEKINVKQGCRIVKFIKDNYYA